MSNTDEIRWQQRLVNFEKAMVSLTRACSLEEYSELERAGLVQMFEVAFELAWKTLKDLLFYEGYDASSPRSVLRSAFRAGYLDEATTETLLEALEKRNLLAHTYSEETAEKAVELVTKNFAPALGATLRALRGSRDTP